MLVGRVRNNLSGRVLYSTFSLERFDYSRVFLLLSSSLVLLFLKLIHDSKLLNAIFGGVKLKTV